MDHKPMKGKHINPLMARAYEHKSRTGPKAREWNDDEVDVFIHWIEGLIDQAQAAHGLGIKGVHVAPNAARALKQAKERGRISIVWEPVKKSDKGDKIREKT